MKPTLDEQTLIVCSKQIDKQTVKSAYLLVLSKIRESESDSDKIFNTFLDISSKRVKKLLFEKDWDAAKEAQEVLKAVFKTISICYAEIGYGVPSELCDIFEETMDEFRNKIDSVDRKVARVFKISEYKKM